MELSTKPVGKSFPRRLSVRHSFGRIAMHRSVTECLPQQVVHVLRRVAVAVHRGPVGNIDHEISAAARSEARAMQMGAAAKVSKVSERRRPPFRISLSGSNMYVTLGATEGDGKH
jgi:hypothetical protein